MDAPDDPDTSGRSAALAAYADRVPRDRVRVTGPDATTFLEGQVSQEVTGLAPGTAAWSFLLQPQGKVDAWVRVVRDASGFVLDVDPGWGEAVAARLRRFLLRVDVTIVVEPTDEAERSADDEAWRIEHGIPAMGAEIREDVIPAELGQWIVDASVSFTKGCFTGQELVARIDSRGGTVPNPLRGLVADEPVAVGAEVLADGEVVGRVTSAGTSPTLGPVALAPVHRSVAVPGAVEVRTDGRSVAAEVRPLPLVAAEG